MIYLDEEAVRQRLDWDALILAMEETLAQFSRGDALQPVRTVLTLEARRRYVGLMPAVVGAVMGMKYVTFYPINADAESRRITRRFCSIKPIPVFR